MIEKWFPEAIDDLKDEWKRLYHYGSERYAYCQFKFLVYYFTDLEIEKKDIMIEGKNIHDYFDRFYKLIKKQGYFDKIYNVMLKKSKTYLAMYIRKIVMKIAKLYRKKKFENGELDSPRVPDTEMEVIVGFSNLESRRLITLARRFDNDKRKVRFYYIPVVSELKLKTDMVGGIIDVIFRDPDVDYLNYDWKTGPKKQKYIPSYVDKQLQTYFILTDENVILDKLTNPPRRIKPDHYAVGYPRFETVLQGKRSDVKIKNIKDLMADRIDAINSWEFSMRCDEKHCKFYDDEPCEYFEPLCRKIMIQEFGMNFPAPRDEIREILGDDDADEYIDLDDDLEKES
jgi:hypothetical protein